MYYVPRTWLDNTHLYMAGVLTLTIYSTSIYAITALRVASRTTLLFVIRNVNPISGTDTSHDGLWKVNTDGTGLTRLISNAAGEITMFNLYTQYVWSTISRDGRTYAVKGIKEGSPSSLLIGSMEGGTPFPVATGVELAGWTTM